MYNDIDLDAVDLTIDAPETEPDRQYYFMAKARKMIQELAAKKGRNLTFYVKTFGCQMNARDSEKILGIMQMIGFEETESEEAPKKSNNRKKKKDTSADKSQTAAV